MRHNSLLRRVPERFQLLAAREQLQWNLAKRAPDPRDEQKRCAERSEQGSWCGDERCLPCVPASRARAADRDTQSGETCEDTRGKPDDASWSGVQ